MRLKLQHSQKGATLVEILVAAAFLGIIVVAGVLQMRNINTVKAALQRGQAIDVIEHSTRALFAREDVLKASADKSSSTKLKQCLNGNGCNNGASYNVDMYLPNQSKPFAGQNVTFDVSGSPCNMASGGCRGVYRQPTRITTRCASGGSCTSASNVSVSFAIVDIKSGKTLRTDVVDRRLATKTQLGGASLSCPSGQILRGIGMNGEALCTKLSNVQYEDAKSGQVSINIKVQPSDCRDKNTTADDQYFVAGYDKNGVVQCKAKDW